MHWRALLANEVVTRKNRSLSRMPAGWPLCANVGDPIYIGESNRQGFIPFKARRPLNARHCASNLPPDGSHWISDGIDTRRLRNLYTAQPPLVVTGSLTGAARPAALRRAGCVRVHFAASCRSAARSGARAEADRRSHEHHSVRVMRLFAVA